MKEMVDIYNENMIKVGTDYKDNVHKNGKWHKTIHCWILRRSKNHEYVLFQKRSNKKKLFPCFYDISAAGHYKSGESVSDGIREMKEELGLNIKYRDMQYLGIKYEIDKYDDILNYEFCEVFLLREDRKLDEYKIAGKEIEGIVQVEIEAGRKLFASNIDQISAKGYFFNSEKSIYEKKNVILTRDSFVPRLDSYYGKIFMLASFYFGGEKNLYI